jgi:hypothetical protein
LDAEQFDWICIPIANPAVVVVGAGAGVAEGVGWAGEVQSEGRTMRRRYRKSIAMRTRPPMKM